jgi:molybdopterin-binding protein
LGFCGLASQGDAVQNQAALVPYELSQGLRPFFIVPLDRSVMLSTLLSGYSGSEVEIPREKGATNLMPQYGARNQISARVTSIKTDEVMSLVKFEVSAPAQMASVLTTESVEDLDLKEGDEVQLVIKAVHVLPVRG